MDSKSQELVCPYCGQPLRLVSHRWFGRGCYECDRCGDFPDLADAPLVRRGRNVSDHASTHVPAKRGDRPRVLLVDDAKEHRDLYALVLETTATVITAARGNEALAIAAHEPLDAIILDVLMPGMDGWEVCARLKANPLTRDIPVIILTSLDGVDSVAPAHRAGATAVLMKPCPIERLARTVEAVTERRADREAPDRQMSVAVRFPSGAAAEATSPKILIVDVDEATVAEARRPLEAVGYLTAGATSFPEGMRAIQAERPDLLIAALRLGEFNGLQFVAMSERPMPTIIIGDALFDETETRALGAEYLSKPLDPSALLTLVRQMFASARSLAPSRRWPRRRVKRPLPAQVGEHPAHLLNVSYGGLCLEIDTPRERIPSSLDVTFPTSQMTVHAELVWLSQRPDQIWLCGAEIPVVTDDWRGLVDAIS